MKVGDLVKNLNSESRMVGIIVGWSDHQREDQQRKRRRDPVVMWEDGRTNWIVRSRAEVINESR